MSRGFRLEIEESRITNVIVRFSQPVSVTNTSDTPFGAFIESDRDSYWIAEKIYLGAAPPMRTFQIKPLVVFFDDGYCVSGVLFCNVF